MTEKPRIQSAARAIDVLRTVAASGVAGATSKRIADELKLPRQVVYHLVQTLVAVGMLRKSSSTGYMLGLGVADLAEGLRRQLAGTDLLGQYAAQAAARTGESAYVVGWVDDDIVVLASARGALPIQASVIPVGTAADAHARASGKLLLSMCASADAEHYLSRHAMHRRTPNTITTRAGLMEELDRIRADWVSVDREEYALGLRCLAVPIGRAPSRMVLGISAPAERLDAKLTEYAAALRSIAEGLVE